MRDMLSYDHRRLHFSRVISILRADITTLRVDAVVNAANKALRGGGGVDGAIHGAAGPELLAELMQYDSVATGDAVITKGYRLPARYVIHAVGPVWRGGNHREPELLERTYESAFARAREHQDIQTIAFPAISTGVYAFPKREAAAIALRTMAAHEHEFREVIACLFDDSAADLYRELVRGSAMHPR
jgi:O-acetyl-ADP-ribose deacetylase (regulator of RNase III)